jgi:hypothetical protein
MRIFKFAKSHADAYAVRGVTGHKSWTLVGHVVKKDDGWNFVRENEIVSFGSSRREAVENYFEYY